MYMDTGFLTREEKETEAIFSKNSRCHHAMKRFSLPTYALIRTTSNGNTNLWADFIVYVVARAVALMVYFRGLRTTIAPAAH